MGWFLTGSSAPEVGEVDDVPGSTVVEIEVPGVVGTRVVTPGTVAADAVPEVVCGGAVARRTVRKCIELSYRMVISSYNELLTLRLNAYRKVKAWFVQFRSCCHAIYSGSTINIG